MYEQNLSLYLTQYGQKSLISSWLSTHDIQILKLKPEALRDFKDNKSLALMTPPPICHNDDEKRTKKIWFLAWSYEQIQHYWMTD